MLSKILVAIFITLLTITVIEIVYLFFSSKPASKVPARDKIATDRIASNVLALSQYAQDGLKGSLVSATFDLEYKGVIEELYTKPGVITLNGYQDRYQLGLKLKGAKGSNYLLFSSYQLQYLQVYDKGQDRKIRFEDLKVGDSIMLEQARDITRIRNQGQNTVKLNITRM